MKLLSLKPGNIPLDVLFYSSDQWVSGGGGGVCAALDGIVFGILLCRRKYFLNTPSVLSSYGVTISYRACETTEQKLRKKTSWTNLK